MRGSIRQAWGSAWSDIWTPLAEHVDAPRELFMELYPELAKAFRATAPEALDADGPDSPSPSTDETSDFFDVANDPELAARRFSEVGPEAFASDRALVRFFREAYLIIEDFGSAALNDEYVRLLAAFFSRYNLRLRVVVPFEIVPEVAAMFQVLVEEVGKQAHTNPHLNTLGNHLESAFAALSRDGATPDVHQCILQACNYVEGIAGAAPGMQPGPLGTLIKRLDVWPHATIREALSSLYGFCSDYPGIRHAGNPAGQLRELSVKDALVIPMLLVAFSGYLVDVDYPEILCLRSDLSLGQLQVPRAAIEAPLQ